MPEAAAPPDEVAASAGTAPQEPRVIPFQPFIPAEVTLPELTALPLVAGTILGIIFGASSLYLVLKVGLTVSASIPVAVISITLFRVLARFGRRRASILENNIVQVAGSAGESIAFGLGVTMPAIMILGFDLEATRVILVAVLGGLLGILMMIPLRRALIVQQHGILKFPEGTACAEVLKAGATPEEHAIALRAAAGAAGPAAGAEGAEVYSGARTIFTGFAIGLLYKSLNVAFKGWKDIAEKVFDAPFKAGSIAAEISPELLGVGYIIGPRVASIMCAGGVLAYLVLIPAIKFFGEHAAGVVPPGTVPIAEMGPNEVRGAYVLYIGAGAVAAGGIISLVRSLPTIWQGIKGGLGDVRRGRSRRTSAAAASVAAAARPRTDQDLSYRFVIGGCVALIAMIMLAPSLHMNLLGALLIVLFGFLFVTVSSRLTGEIGSTSNPISGMTVATLLLTCLVFLLLGWTGPSYYVTALSVGAIVCIACSNGGTIAQSLKTGFLLGGTPRQQQIAILVGSLASSLALGPILLLLNDTSTVYVPRETVARVADASGRVTPKIEHNFPAGLRTDPGKLGVAEKLRGPQARNDPAAYRVWQKTDDAGGPPGRYLVDASGTAVYLVDPGINGTHRSRPDGSRVAKFDAPKATLMSYIIKGILNHQLPWALVLLGVMIALVLEMSGISSLPFAVGVYLPLSSTSPIFIGGLVRLMIDRHLRKKLANRRLSEEQLVAEGDKSPGVLLASGYIAGGAITGIVIALINLVPALGVFGDRVNDLMSAHNPFFNGPAADALSLLPFAVLVLLLYLAGREVILAGRR
ncbi:MAG TPA: oligopeptide transporter, OPT family [Thermoanaerobaculia bacterium]|nr:oligopeptide transporter, OPT family [Thermoanaerobaculia bacterium]